MKSVVDFILGFIIGPINLLLIGPVGNTFSMIAFKRLSSRDEAYRLQALVIVNDTLQIVAGVLFGFIDLWLRLRSPTPLLPFGTSYPLMFYAAHLMVPLGQVTMTSGMFILLGVCHDRLQALTNPLRYKLINHRRRVHTIAITAYVSGVVTSVYDMPRHRVVDNGEQNSTAAFGYLVVVNHQYVNHGLTQRLFLFQQLVRIMVFLGVAVFSSRIILLYRQKKRLVGTSPAESSGVAMRKQVHENTVTVLLLLQCLLMSVTFVPNLLSTLQTYALPQLNHSFVDVLLVRLMQFMFTIQCSWNFCLYAGFSRKFRAEFLRSIGIHRGVADFGFHERINIT